MKNSRAPHAAQESRQPGEEAAGKRILTGFIATASGSSFILHLADDIGEVFEIEASRDNVRLMIANLRALLPPASETRVEADL